MSRAAIAVAKAARYTNAGRLNSSWMKREFLLSEMNKRIQVEHPITEEVTGVDIVREQIAIVEASLKH